MDTGSNLIWINCWPCGLNVPEPIYSPNASKSYMIEDCFSDICTDSGAVRIVPCLRVCPYEVSYGGGGSTGGILARETFKFGTGNNEALHNLTFGCARYNKNMFMNGILGLGSLKLSLVSQYGSSKFAYCIGNISDRSSAYSTLVIGQNVKHWGVETPLFIEDKYYVNLESIKIGTTSLAFDPRIFRRNSSEYTGGMVIDTGSTLTHIPIKVLLAFEATIMELIEVELGLDIVRNDTIPYKHEEYETMRLCYNGVVTRDLVKYFRLTRNVDFPTVKLGFQGGMTMELSAENIFQQTFENTFCSVIVPSEALRTTISILGNWMQQRFYFAYHLDQSVLSFTPAKNCKLDVEKHYIHDEL
ncbi:aspartic proteinase nepenthesin-1 [Phtheirospermum japonicum]|uniref:Aspartic proteinase nepenthesin-1 n=1 Tax=Phtheirospermum japonicum TaxID=374723 RepID=A0A830B9X8_9LAMI|nr:aspartic proteinase nepenthesin-1 [Phtheirospermum japonicum]